MIDFLKLLGGLVLLLVSGDYLVKGGVNFARHLKLPTMVVALTVVAFGTSAPELLVSIQAALHGHPDISLGNVVGSNISNIALVLALSAIVLPISVRKASIKFDWPIMMLSGIMVFIFAFDNILSWWEGIILLIFLGGFIYFSFSFSKQQQSKEVSKEFIPLPEFSIFMAIFMIVLSCVGLSYGANLLVDGAAIIARNMGISERVISITLIAIGTSLPELVTSIMAAIRKEADISIGNIIGSNIFNTFGVLGMTSVLTPIKLSREILSFDLYWMLGIYLLLFLFILPLKGGVLTRFKSFILFAVYLLYIYLLFRS